MSLYEKEFKESTIIHIPHSSTEIPDLNSYTDLYSLGNMIKEVTDWKTDEIFHVDGVETVKCEWSRVFCDVERYRFDLLDDDGHGFYYTKDLNRNTIRDLSQKDFVLKNYYDKYHSELQNKCQSIIDKKGFCYLFDCHSFSPNAPFTKKEDRPDICIGLNDSFNSFGLLTTIKRFFEKKYNVLINSPYKGSIQPILTPKLESIMIEVNQSLYMNDKYIKEEKVKELNKDINDIFSIILEI